MRLSDIVLAPFFISVCFDSLTFVLGSRGENCLFIARADLDELRFILGSWCLCGHRGMVLVRYGG